MGHTVSNLQIDLPQPGEHQWGQPLNDAVLQVLERVNDHSEALARMPETVEAIVDGDAPDLEVFLENGMT